MGFILSVLYLLTHYLTPDVVFGGMGASHIELILATLALLASIPKLPESFLGRTSQSIALVGLAFAVFTSVLIGMRWAGGAFQGFFNFIPSPFAYFLICLHCNSKKKLQIVIMILMFVCFFVIAHGYADLVHGVPDSDISQNPYPGSGPSGSIYFYRQMTTTTTWINRLMGQGEISDPNDFAQLLVCVIPLVFFFWQPRKVLKNLVFVWLPVSVLLFGAYLTHSRGGMLALLVMAIVLARRRIGTLRALLLAAALFAAAMAMHFTGGRDISADAGEDRTDLWGESMELLRSHPAFGVGYAQLPDYLGHTAHNSLLVCAAELGFFGLYFWTFFLVPTLRDAWTIASPLDVNEPVQIVEKPQLRPLVKKNIETIDKSQFNRLGRLLFLSLTGFLVAGWFLSRAFATTLFLLGGMVEVVYELALQRGMISPRMPATRILRFSGFLAIGLIIVMYMMLRTVNLMH